MEMAIGMAIGVAALTLLLLFAVHTRMNYVELRTLYEKLARQHYEPTSHERFERATTDLHQLSKLYARDNDSGRDHEKACFDLMMRLMALAEPQVEE